MQLKKDIELKEDDIIEITYTDSETDYIKVKEYNVNRIVVDDNDKIKRIRVRRKMSEHLDEIIFNSDNEIKKEKENNMELKDIVLKEGDIVYFDDNPKLEILKNETKIYPEEIPHIVKIERPHYETIYEAPKEILDKEEKEWLEHLQCEVQRLDYVLTALTDFIYTYFYNNHGLVSDEEFDKLKGLL